MPRPMNGEMLRGTAWRIPPTRRQPQFSANGSTARLRTSITQYLSGDKFATDTGDDGTEGFGRHRKLTHTHPNTARFLTTRYSDKLRKTRGHFPRNALQLRKSRCEFLKPAPNEPCNYPAKTTQPPCNQTATGAFYTAKISRFPQTLDFFPQTVRADTPYQ